MLPGGFSGGDEPDGSAKFIAAFFRNPAVADAVDRPAEQAGRPDAWASATASRLSSSWAWCPTARSAPSRPTDPTLTFNTIGRHQSMLVRTRVASQQVAPG